MTCTEESGTCARCQSACKHKPGWFLPGEAEKAAEYLNLTLEEFFHDYLAVDWWVDYPNVYVLSPAVVGADTGTEFSGDPHGTCIFYVDKRCQIHAVKPYECRKMWCGQPDGIESEHGKVADVWRDDEHQQQVRDLLGREPVATEYSGGLMDWLFG